MLVDADVVFAAVFELPQADKAKAQTVPIAAARNQAAGLNESLLINLFMCKSRNLFVKRKFDVNVLLIY